MKSNTPKINLIKWLISIFLFFALVPFSLAQTFNGTTGAITNINCAMPDVFSAVVGTPNLILDEINIDISHDAAQDLQLYLKSPTGEILELSTGNGGFANDYTNTVFTDDSPTFITSGSAPFTGSFKPEGRSDMVVCNPPGNLGDFSIQSQFGTIASDGTWELHIMDFANFEVGMLNSWSLTFVPIPLEDAEVVSITHVLNNACFGNAETVEVVVMNKGDNDIQPGDLTIELTGAENSPITMMNSTSITTFGLETITFINVDLSVVAKIYSLTGTATLPGDTNPNNNAVSTTTFNACGGSNFTFTVTNINDSGSGSLREAITVANSAAGMDIIEFDIPGGGPHTIILINDLPIITDIVTIDGSTQPNFVTAPEIVIQATLKGFQVVSASGTIIKFIALHSGASIGIEIDQSDNVSIEGCHIGNDATGNTTGLGFSNAGLICSSSENLILKNNVITETALGVFMITGCHGAVIEGNHIGVSASGMVELENILDGVRIQDSDNISIGGNNIDQRNLISGNVDDGIRVENCTTLSIINNYIGTDINGTAALPNLNGLRLINSSNVTIKNNLISGNTFAGMLLDDLITGSITGNLVGVDNTGLLPLGNGDDGLEGDNLQGFIIGGPNLADRNIFSGNMNDGMTLFNSPSVVIENNIFGLGIDGVLLIPNSFDGFDVIGCDNGIVRDNIISGNLDLGLNLVSPNMVVEGNKIGTDISGTIAKGNGDDGIRITGGNNTIGGTDSSQRNIISANGDNGIKFDNSLPGNVVIGNFIGLDESGTVQMNNALHGIRIEDSPNVTIGSVDPSGRNVITSNIDGIRIIFDEAINNLVLNNFIGTDLTGTIPLPVGFNGISILNDAANNQIGQPDAGNVIVSASNHGIFFDNEAAFNTIQSNFIGTDLSGTINLGNNQNGILIEDASNNVIGGSNAGEGNLIVNNGEVGVKIKDLAFNPADANSIIGNTIKNNGFEGIEVSGNNNIVLSNEISNNTGAGINLFFANNSTIGQANAGNIITNNDAEGIVLFFSEENLVQGNFIGTDITGFQDLGNTLNGIFVDGSTLNLIGGSNPGEGNLIANNGLNGITFIEDEFDPNNKNEIFANSIFDNALLGIDLGDDGITPNDALDGDTGSNELQNFPVITSSVLAGGNVTINGTFNSIPNATIRIDFYNNIGTNAAGNVEGREFLGSQNVTTDGNGDATFNVNFATTITSSDFVSATATDSNGNTSEFSEALIVLPIELLSFSARSLEKQILLNWTTASEINNAGFEIERSLDGFDFEKIAWKVGKGNAQNENHYVFNDRKVLQNQIYYYRLRQIDLDGRFDYSNIVKAKILSTYNIEISPNPTYDRITIHLSDDLINEPLTIEIFNIIGSQVFSRNAVLNNETTFQFSFQNSNFSKGMYFLKIKHMNSEIFSEKLIFN